MDKPESPLAFDIDREQREPQECCDRIKEKFSQERDIRLRYRPDGTAQLTSDFNGALEKYSVDSNEREFRPHAPLADRQPRNLIEDLER